jgi:hypothetical protein
MKKYNDPWLKVARIIEALIEISIIVGVCLIFSSCVSYSGLGRCPVYTYEYRRSDGSIGRSKSIVQYDLGDTVKMIPSGSIFVITKISLDYPQLKRPIVISKNIKR